MICLFFRLLAQTTLRNILGKSKITFCSNKCQVKQDIKLGTKNLHEILSDRESISGSMQVGVSFLGWKSFPFALPCSIYNCKPILWTVKISQTSKLVSTRRIITWKEWTANLLIIDGAPKKGLKENVREQILVLDSRKLPKVSNVKERVNMGRHHLQRRQQCGGTQKHSCPDGTPLIHI